MSTHLEREQTDVAAAVVDLTYREAVRAALEHEMEEDPTVLLMGGRRHSRRRFQDK